MAFDGNGTFVRLYSWQDDRDAAIKIRADRQDAEHDGFATGLSTAICKDGQTNPTANLKMGGFRHTGVGNASARTHYGVVGQIQDGSYIYAADAGSADAYSATLTPNISAYATGQVFAVLIQSGNQNTGACTLDVGPGATNIKLIDGNDPGAGDIGAAASTKMHYFAYDGTNFILLNPQGYAHTGQTNTFTDQTPINCEWSDDGAGTGPIIITLRISATPAVNDVLGSLKLRGMNDNSPQDIITYGELRARILDETSTTENGVLEFRTVVDGTEAGRLRIGAGAYTKADDAHDMGPGTINAEVAVYLNAGPFWSSGTGSPEGAVTAPVSSLYSRTDGGAGTSLYVKESGSGNTGWIAK